MDNSNNFAINQSINISSEDLATTSKDAQKSTTKPSKSWLVFLISGIVAFLGGIGCAIYTFLIPEEVKENLIFPTIPSQVNTSKTYSNLTGLELADANLKNSPAYCVQTPNDTYGARPQTGLNNAGVIFEAIAEGGITRFAAIYQNPTVDIFGPVRSIRLYYLDWDTPFDCTVVHAGGSIEALDAISSRGTKHLTENYSYMYRGNYIYHSYDNIFLTPNSLASFSSDYGYTTSEISGFTRLNPNDSIKNRYDNLAISPLEITTPSVKDTSELDPVVSEIHFDFGGSDEFNIDYTYNLDTNSYDRSYTYGGKHEVYSCTNGEDLFDQDPADVCPLVQLSPNVIIAMMVDERRHRDGVHEAITTVGEGTAYVFQNGDAIKGTWKKSSLEDQIRFYDEDDKEISLAPGQTWISALPISYGGYVDY